MIVYCCLGTAPTFMGIPAKMAGVSQVLMAFPDCLDLKRPLDQLDPLLNQRVKDFEQKEAEK